jgi:hypothetical protein
MGRFEPLVSATPRRSNFVSNAELLRMMELHSLANHGPRKWTFFKGGRPAIPDSHFSAALSLSGADPAPYAVFSLDVSPL